jgi:hypothetical protein
MAKGGSGPKPPSKGGESAACGYCQPAHEEIARQAYERWLAGGGTHGHDIADWVEAECELRHERRRQRHGAAA